MQSGYQHIKNVSLNFVNAMKLGDHPSIYQKEAGGGESFYGCYHALHILDIFNELGEYSNSQLDQWANYFQNEQTDFGFFTNKLALKNKALIGRDLDPVWHYTRGHIWSYRILDRQPEISLQFVEPFVEADYLYQYIKSYDWSNSWAAGNQICALATALQAYRDWQKEPEVDAVMEKHMFSALQELIDPATGYWGTQLGADLKNGLFGTIHVAPIYFSQKWPLPYLEKNVDATLECQYPDGSYWPGGSDCPDFDGAYMLANLHALTDYRKEDMKAAARNLLQHLLMHEDPQENGWLLHRTDSQPKDWQPRPHFIWKPGERNPIEELRDDDPNRTHIMLGSWFYPLSIALLSQMLGNTGYEGPYRINPMSLHQSNVWNQDFKS